MGTLTTTSYAVLGLLALRPWSAYELTRTMRTSAVRAAWPRTESRLYEEPKNLVGNGLLRSSTERTGRRGRTVYTITDKGRRALRRWLSERPAPEQVHDEMLLRLLFVDQGDREQALAAIRAAMEALQGELERVAHLAPRMARGEARFPERLHVAALSAQRGVGQLRARLEFLRWADAWVRSWKGTRIDARKRETAAATLRAAAEEVEGMRRELGALMD